MCHRHSHKPLAGSAADTIGANAEKEVIALSKDKWRWMAEWNVEAQDKLFAEGAVFVHMGGTITKGQELDVIKSGRIQYKDAQIQEVSVRFVGATAILFGRTAWTPWWVATKSQPLHRDRGVRPAERGVEARLALRSLG